MHKLKHIAAVMLLFLLFSIMGCKSSVNEDEPLGHNHNVSEGDTSDEVAELLETSLPEQSTLDENAYGNENQENVDMASLLKKEVIVIHDAMFESMCMEINRNAREYLGKTIQIEGLAGEHHQEDSQEPITLVYHTSVEEEEHGAHEDHEEHLDGMGFEYIYDGELPKKDDWIEVIGTLESYEEDGQEYLRIHADSVTVK